MKDLTGYPLAQISPDTPDAELRAFHEADIISRRRAHVQKWIRQRGRGISVVSAGGLVFLPLLAAGAAQAQDGPVLVDSISGVTDATLNADGSLQVTLSNGQVATISASEVTVLANGQIAVSAAAAESIVSLAALAAGVGTAGIAAVAGGLALAGAAAGAGGGGSSSDPVLVGGGGVLGAFNPLALNAGAGAGGVLSTQNFAGFAPAGSLVQITIDGPDGEPLLDPNTGTPFVFSDVADEDGNYSIEIPIPTLGLTEGDYRFTIEAFEVDEDGDPQGDPLGKETVDITVDTTPPVIEIDTPIADNDLINIADSQGDLTITGTTDAENGQEVTVTINGQEYTGTVASGTWSVSVPAADLQALPDGVVEITFDVFDAAGNAASDNPDTERSVTVDVDLTAPVIEIDDPLTGNNVFSKLNEANGLEVTGETDAEDGQVVTVTFNGVDYASDPISGPAWSVLIPPAAFDGLETGDEITGITARVSDAAGNPSDVATGPTVAVDLTGPAITIDPVAVDGIINIDESGEDVTISGTAEGAEGQEVTVEIESIGFSATDTVSGGTWSVTLPQATVEGLADGSTFTVTANVSDAEGIAAPQATRDFATDYTAPEVTITGTRSGDGATDLSTDNILNASELNQSLTIFGTTTGVADELLVTIVTPSGATLSAEVIDNAWQVTVDPNLVQAYAGAAPEGDPLVFTATVRDAADNPSDPAELTMTADLTAPVIEIDPLTGNNQLTLADKGNAVTVTGSTDAEPGQEVTVIFNGTELEVAVVLAGGGSGDLPNSWETIIPADLTDALEDEEGADEEYALTAQVNDIAGNPSQTVEITITTDFSAPTISFNVVAGDDVINADEASDPDGVVIGGTTTGLETGQMVKIFLNGEEIGEEAVDAEGRFELILPLADIPDDGGPYTLSASGENLEGVDAVVTPRAFSVDTAPPDLDITSVAGNGFFGAAARDTSGITVEGTSNAGGAEVTVTLTDGSDNVVTATATVTSGAWTATFAGGNDINQLGNLVEGAIEVEASVTNSVGNSSTDSDTATAKFTPPAVFLDDLPFGEFLNAMDAGQPQEISGRVENGTGDPVTVSIFGTADPETPLFSQTINPEPDGTWSLTLTADELGTGEDGILPEGLLTVRVTTTDLADNPGVSAPIDFTVDRIAPEVTIETIAGQNIAGDVVINIASREDGFVVTGSTDASEAGRDVTVTIAGVIDGLGTGVVEEDGSWSVSMPANLALVNESDIEFTASITDAAGNTGSSAENSASVNLNVPTITFNLLAGDDILNILESNEEALVVSGTTSFFAEGDQITISADGIADIVVTVDASGNFTTAVARDDVFALIAAATGAAPTLDADGDLVSAGAGAITFTASGTNSVGNSADAQDTTLTLALTPPALEITAIERQGESDLGGVINIAERAAGLEIRGTSDAEDQDVTVTLTDGADFTATATATVTGGIWFAQFDALSLEGLPDATLQVSISAEVSDTNGNAATTDPEEVPTDFISPVIAISTITVLGSEGVEIGDFLNIADKAAGVTVAGTTDAEDGQIVTVTLSAEGMADIVKDSGPLADGQWSLDLTSAELADLPDGETLTWTATVSDAAGNPSDTSDPITAEAAFTPPSVTIDSHAIDGVMTGSSTGLAEGTMVTLTLPNVDPNTPLIEFNIYTTPVDDSGMWEFQIPKSAAANRFVGLHRAYNREFDMDASVTDVAGNSGEAGQGVTIYLPPGHMVLEGSIDGNLVVYEIYQTEERRNEGFTFSFDDEQSEYEAHVPRVDFADQLIGTVETVDLTNVTLTTVDGLSALAVTMVNLFRPIEPITDPILELTMSFPEGSDVVAQYVLRPQNSEVIGGALEVVFGSSGDDPDITVTSLASYVRGKGGDDTIDLSAGGANTVIFEPDLASNGFDTIIGFQAGPDAKLPDQIGFAGLEYSALRGDGTDVQELGEGGTLGTNTGFVILTGLLADIDADALQAAAEGLGGAEAGNLLYLLATDGEDSALARVSYDDADTASVDILAQFTGLDSRLVGANDILGFNSETIT